MVNQPVKMVVVLLGFWYIQTYLVGANHPHLVATLCPSCVAGKMIIERSFAHHQSTAQLL